MEKKVSYDCPFPPRKPDLPRYPASGRTTERSRNTAPVGTAPARPRAVVSTDRVNLNSRDTNRAGAIAGVAVDLPSLMPEVAEPRIVERADPRTTREALQRPPLLHRVRLRCCAAVPRSTNSKGNSRRNAYI